LRHGLCVEPISFVVQDSWQCRPVFAGRVRPDSILFLQTAGRQLNVFPPKLPSGHPISCIVLLLLAVSDGAHFFRACTTAQLQNCICWRLSGWCSICSAGPCSGDVLVAHITDGNAHESLLNVWSKHSSCLVTNVATPTTTKSLIHSFHHTSIKGSRCAHRCTRHGVIIATEPVWGQPEGKAISPYIGVQHTTATPQGCGAGHAIQ
jgi:hypothetical protein